MFLSFWILLDQYMSSSTCWQCKKRPAAASNGVLKGVFVHIHHHLPFLFDVLADNFSNGL
jgi:hypothetical protein